MNTHQLLIIPTMPQEPTSSLDCVDGSYYSALFEEDQEETTLSLGFVDDFSLSALDQEEPTSSLGLVDDSSFSALFEEDQEEPTWSVNDSSFSGLFEEDQEEPNWSVDDSCLSALFEEDQEEPTWSVDDSCLSALFEEDQEEPTWSVNDSSFSRLFEEDQEEPTSNLGFVDDSSFSALFEEDQEEPNWSVDDSCLSALFEEDQEEPTWSVDDSCLSTLFEEDQEEPTWSVNDSSFSGLFEEDQEEPTSIVDDSCFSDQEEILGVSDAKCAQELQLQKTLTGSVTVCNSVSNHNFSSPSPKPNIQFSPVVPTELVIKMREGSGEGFGESSMSFCKICIERKESNDMFTIDGCDHSFCSDCVGKHVHAKIQESLSVVCPALECKNVLQLEACRPVISKDVIDLWEMALCEDVISKTPKFYCPFKDCSAMFLIENEEGEVIRESECPFCHRLFCAQCSAGWHPGVECEEYQRLNEDERGREDLMVRELANENKWSRCPKCRFYVERTEGCPHITCRCKYQFCYGCEDEWSPSHGGCQKQ